MPRMTDSADSLLPRAIGLLQHGNIAAAEQLLRRLLDANPGNVDALHFLGVAALQRGQPAEAVRLIGEATAAAPGQAHIRNNLGIAQRGAGLLEEALQTYDRAIALHPDYPDAFNNRGSLLEQLGRPEEALASYDRAIALRPAYAEAFYNRANALKSLKRRVEAMVSYDRAIELRPGYAAAVNNRGILQQLMGAKHEALASFEAAIALQPDNAEAIYNRANVLNELNRPEEAIAGYQQALKLRPDYADALNNCGNAMLAANRHAEGLACYERAIALRPGWAEVLNNRCTALLALGRHEEAVASADRAIALRPEYPEARMNRGMCRLTLGDFERGWRDFEWRWQVARLRPLARKVRQRLWLGDFEIAGRTILLHAEQGFGDVLQFCRYVPLVAARANVVLEAPAPLYRLLMTLEGPQHVVLFGSTLPPFDLHCPLLSLPLALGTTLPTIPSQVPYLWADEEQIADWRRRLDGLPGLRVGLVWAGGLRPDLQAVDRRRSITLGHFGPLAALPGISLVSLQKGEPATQVGQPPPGMTIHDWTDELTDFADTAALVAALDLVITVDTAVAHLAGALGKKVWILNRFDACWRWLLGREDSPWYPTARLFIQPVAGDWDTVISCVCGALREWLAAPSAG